MLLPNPNPLLVAGGPALDMARARYFGGSGQSVNPNRNKNRRPYQSIITPSGNNVMTGDLRKKQAINHYFGGQQQFYGSQDVGGGYYSNKAQALTGMGGAPMGGMSVKSASMSLGESTNDWMMSGKISPEDMNIARNRANMIGTTGPGSGRLGWGSGEYGGQDETMSQMPKGYYVGLGNKVRNVDKSNKEMAGRYDDLRKYGFLGPEPWKEHNAEVSRKLADLRDRLAHGSSYGYGDQGGAPNMPMEHTRPQSPGEFTLGYGQGMRVKAWERRQIAKVEEAKRDDLKLADDKGDAIQQEASVVKPAQETERI